MKDPSLSRERFIQGAAAGAASLSFGVPAFVPRRSEAADMIMIGVAEPYSGVYAAYGESETRGAQAAVDAWNKKGGVMGRKVAFSKEDEQSDPGVGVQKARKLVNQDKCVALMGAVSSAVALSVSGAANALGTLYIDSGGHTDDVTGKDCHWNTFRVCHSTWMETHATGATLAKKFGKKWYLITPDYAFGHSLSIGYKDVAEKLGCTIVHEDLAPLGTTDFSPYLTKVLPANPDVLLILPQGDDFVNCVKQANQFGILKKIAAGGPQVELEAVWALPPEARVGFWGVEWYYKGATVLGPNNTAAAQWVADYRKKYGTPPTARSFFGYTAMDRILWGINEAKSTDSQKVAKALEGAHFTNILLGGTSFFRKEDHQMMWPMWTGEVRANGTPGDKYDVFNIVDRQPALAIEQTVAEKEKVCKLNYPS
jgi:branched-chain amino acid transport system substrate-binding protein